MCELDKAWLIFARSPSSAWSVITPRSAQSVAELFFADKPMGLLVLTVLVVSFAARFASVRLLGDRDDLLCELRCRRQER